METQKQTYIDQISDLKKKWEKLDPGKPAPVFAYPDIDSALADLVQKGPPKG